MPRRETAPLGAPCWIDLFSSDTDKARSFYAELFGWTGEEATEEFGGYFNFGKDGVRVAGCMHNDGSSGSPDGWNTYLATDDAVKTNAAAAEHGATVYVEPMQVGPYGSMGLLGDPTGAAIGIWQPDSHRGFGVLAEPGTPAWFELHTTGYETAIAFYRDVFGWDTHTMSDTPDFKYTTLGEGDDALAGIMDGAEDAGSQWTVYFAVADTDASAATVIASGGTVTADATNTPFGRLAKVTDPTGATFSIVGPNT